MRRTVYFDLETGGLTDAHPDIQLAAVALDDETGAEIETFSRRLAFDVALADPAALAMNHYGAEVWNREALPPQQVVSLFGQFLQRHKCLDMKSRSGGHYSVARLAGHNAATFDGPRLKRLFDAHGVFMSADLRVRDTLQLALWYFDTHGFVPPVDYKLTTLARYFRVPVGDSHEALADVRLTIALAKALRAQSVTVAA